MQQQQNQPQFIRPPPGLPATRFIQQGGNLPSPTKLFVLFVGYDGTMQVINTQNRQVMWAVKDFNRRIMPPFFLRL